MDNSFHTHTDAQGFVHRCYHKTRLSWKAWLLAGAIAMFAYPIEHAIWENVPPFKNIAQKLHIGVDHGTHTE